MFQDIIYITLTLILNPNPIIITQTDKSGKRKLEREGN